MKIQVGLMGMRCITCKKPMGALTVPEGMTVEAITMLLRTLKAYPICEECILKDPSFQDPKSVIMGT